MEKNKIALADLHMHCRASDGTDDIYELLEKIRAAGIKVFSVTDHDTIRGAMAMKAVVPDDITFVCGIEFSCITKIGKCHILGYGYHKEEPAFKEILRQGREKRQNKLKRRLAYMKEEFGIEIPKEQREMFFAMDSVGKPHLGNMLVSMGLAKNKNEAIEKYVNPCKTEDDRLDAGEVIRAILASGGLPVWAHPYGGTNEKAVLQEVFEHQLAYLMKEGLKGLECYYSSYTEGQVASLLDAAFKNHLLISGGSDYHGAGKDVALGALNNYGEKIGADKLTLLAACTYRGK